MQEERLHGALQENILTLLVFDDSVCKIIRNSITPKLFESSIYRDIASHAFDFIDQFGEAAKEHLPDQLEHILKGDDSRKAQAYTRVLDNLYEAREVVNRDYVVSQLNKFVRQQSIKSAIVKAVEALEDDRVDDAEVEINKGLQSQIVSFDPGMSFADPRQSLTFLDSSDDFIHTGIEELDKREIGPRPKELFLFVAPAKKGKSWALIHCGKFSLLQRKRVLHITLEMSQERVAQRYIQSFFGVSKRDPIIRIPQFRLDRSGDLLGVDFEEVERVCLRDPNIRKILTSKLQREFRRRPPLIIKEFPTGSLTVSALNAYLDGLERFHKFVPDVIIMDYPDLMKLDSANLRLDTGKIYKDIRGVAVERNLAMVAASQGNRQSSEARVVTDAMIAEDYSKIATADNVLTYSQTKPEKMLGLARLFVSNARNDDDKFEVLISQSYAIGQFCLDSTHMASSYWDQVDRMIGQHKEDDDEE